MTSSTVYAFGPASVTVFPTDPSFLHTIFSRQKKAGWFCVHGAYVLVDRQLAMHTKSELSHDAAEVLAEPKIMHCSHGNAVSQLLCCHGW